VGGLRVEVALGSGIGEAVAGTAVEVDVGVAGAIATVGEGSMVGEGGGVTASSVGMAIVAVETEVGTIWLTWLVGISVQPIAKKIVKINPNSQNNFMLQITPAHRRAGRSDR
jgi:hypothetical protein